MLVITTLLAQFLTSLEAGSFFSQPKVIATVGDYGDISLSSLFATMPVLDLRVINSLFPLAFMIALLGILEASSVAKAMAAQSGHRFSVNQEIFGLGVSNFLSAFGGAMVSSGSPSRSALNYNSGAQSRFSSMFNGIFVAILIFFLSDVMVAVPLASLAALLLVTASSMVDGEQFRLSVWSCGSDALVLFVTILVSFFLSLDAAFFMGVSLSICLYLRKASTLGMVEYEFNELGEFCPIPHGQERPNPEVCLINVEGDLFFGASDLFEGTVKAISNGDKIKVLILHIRNVRYIDATTCFALKQLNEYMHTCDRQLILSGVPRYLARILMDSGVQKDIGSEFIFHHSETEPQFFLQDQLLLKAEQVLLTKKRFLQEVSRQSSFVISKYT